MENDALETPEDAAIVESSKTEAMTPLLDQTGDEFLFQIERAAENAERIVRAKRAIMIAITYPQDWSLQGDKGCLSSAGAERFLSHFPITFRDWKCEKEKIVDSHGEGYRWIYTVTAALNGCEILAHGAYGTRDKFLSYTSADGYRATEDINENDIRAAARHICIGNGIKTLLGLRGIPATTLSAFLTGSGSNGGAPTTVKRGQGTKGGTSDTDREKQDNIWKMLGDMYGGNEADMKEALKGLTSFDGRDGKVVYCDDIRKLKAGYLGKTYPKVKAAYEKWEKMTGDGEAGGGEGDGN